MNPEEIHHTIRLARAYCSEKLSWFAPAMFRCKIILTEQVPIAAIDCHYNIYFNPKAIVTIRDSSHSVQDIAMQVGFLWVHEISHILRDHADRAEDLKVQAKFWNIAADLEINDGRWDGLRMPKAFPGLLPYKYDLQNGKLAEWYYNKILEDQKLKNNICSACEGVGGHVSWDEGSGVHNESRPWESEDGTQPQQLHTIDKEVIRREVANEMKRNSNLIGKMPGSWGLWVKEILESKTDWKQLLHHRMSRAIATGIGLRIDYSFARPSRRQSVYHPIITPSFSGERSGNIAIVVDTSGSMGGDQLGQAVGEVCKVLEDFKMPVTVIPCDTKAYEPIVLKTPKDRFKVKQLKGGGGTNMIVGIKAALDLKPKPDTVLVLTDGYTDYPPKPYKIPIMFGIIKYTERKTPVPKMPPWKATSVVDILIKR